MTEELVKATSKEVNKWKFSQETKEFLTKIGLPRKFTFGDEQLNFLVNGLLSLSKKQQKVVASLSLISTEKIKIDPKSCFCQIGSSDYGWYCIEESSERIFDIFPESEGWIRFVNSSVAQFAECILLWRNFEQETHGTGMGEKEFHKRIKRLRKDLSKIDVLALKDKDSFWSPHLEEYEYGMFG